MFSNDKNIETISQLIEALRGYITAEKEHMKFSITEKLIRLLKSIIAFSITFALLLFTVIFTGIALALYLSTLIHPCLAFLCVALLFIALVCIIRIYSMSLIEKPLVRIISGILLNNE